MDAEHVSQDVQGVVLEKVEVVAVRLSFSLPKVDIFNPITKQVESDHFDKDIVQIH